MQDALAVRVVQGAGDGAHHLDHVLEIDRVAEAVREGPALHQLEHEVGDAVLLAVVEDVEDVGVLEAGYRSRLLLETFAIGLLLREEVRKDLDRDITIERRMVRPVHGRHPAASDATRDPVRSQGEALR